MDPQGMLMNIMGMQEGQHAQQPISFEDPMEMLDWGEIAREFQLSPEEVQQIRIRPPGQGPSLVQRLQALRPQMQIGDMEIQLEDNGISGRMEF